MTSPPAGRALLVPWLTTVTAAEFAGFLLPASVGAITAGARPSIQVPAVLAAGVFEGLVLGWGQARVLKRALPGLPARRWMIATAAGAVVAYAIGFAPSALADVWTAWPAWVTVLVAVLVGVVLLCSIGMAQRIVLRRFLPRTGLWVIASAVAWLAGLTAFLAFAMPLWHPGQRPAEVVAIGLAGGLLMAAVMAAITGLAVVRLVRSRSATGAASGTAQDRHRP